MKLSSLCWAAGAQCRQEEQHCTPCMSPRHVGQSPSSGRAADAPHAKAFSNEVDASPAKQIITPLRGTCVFGGGAPGRGVLAAGAANVQVVVGALPHCLRLAQLGPALVVPPVVKAEPGHRLHVPHLLAMYAHHECCQHSTITAVCGMAAKRQAFIGM